CDPDWVGSKSEVLRDPRQRTKVRADLRGDTVAFLLVVRTRHEGNVDIVVLLPRLRTVDRLAVAYVRVVRVVEVGADPHERSFSDGRTADRDEVAEHGAIRRQALATATGNVERFH